MGHHHNEDRGCASRAEVGSNGLAVEGEESVEQGLTELLEISLRRIRVERGRGRHSFRIAALGYCSREKPLERGMIGIGGPRSIMCRPRKLPCYPQMASGCPGAEAGTP